MAIHRLLDDFEETEFTLIALHSHLEDYRLAYWLNKALNIRLSKAETIEIAAQKVFENFEWLNEQEDVMWNLVANTTYIQKKRRKAVFSLFEAEEQPVKGYLIPEMKKVDYFLKIDTEEMYLNISDITSKIQQIPNIITTYKVAANQLKSKTNLIF
ncbi:hypothetical protein SAMN05216480_1019 [Pustulibacterium marinum]|uniref:IPExxxVDY family protein n=1 Tax=Pustulibacterium marinum TaxID=1224947 RepID=A0A1I7ESR0_9FLAO|nr:IPExxxVDY family protein [Pustulibacterium marinum]SFU26956.1 hypothetical protein SAMN05216480_1019 [Pustulibacterium marinum]